MEISKDLIKKCVKKDRDSQEQLFKLLYSSIFKICFRYSSNNDEAKDYLQFSFLKIFSKMHTFKGKGSFQGWARRVARNHIVDDIRSRKLDIQFDKDPEFIPEETEEMKFELDNASTTERILEEIQKLSTAYRTVFNLYVIDGLKHEEIAEYLNISVGASKSNYSKARKKLQISLKEFRNEY